LVAAYSIQDLNGVLTPELRSMMHAQLYLWLDFLAFSPRFSSRGVVQRDQGRDLEHVKEGPMRGRHVVEHRVRVTAVNCDR
jgi:hypothetical protein